MPDTTREKAEKIVLKFIRGKHPLESHAEQVDAITVALEAESASVAARLAEAERLLAPFALMAWRVNPKADDEQQIIGSEGTAFFVKALRAATAFLSSPTSTGERETADERSAKIVAWLRDNAIKTEHSGDSPRHAVTVSALFDMANAIERGDWKDKEHGDG